MTDTTEPARTIDEVIARLTAIVDESRASGSRLGYFPALYRRVTEQVKAKIESGCYFDDGERMGRLDVTFANRYLTALDLWRKGNDPGSSWAVAFDTSRRWQPLIVQHLLLGINAHINLDLGIACAEICPGDSIPSLAKDFDRINAILASLIGKVMKEIEQVSPWIALLDQFGGRTEKELIRFSLDVARRESWSFAELMARVAPSQRTAAITARDRGDAELGRVIRYPGWLLDKGLLLIRLRESNDVRRVIDVLSG